jgi:hypothetical protein
MQNLYEQGRIVQPSEGAVRYKRYLDVLGVQFKATWSKAGIALELQCGDLGTTSAALARPLPLPRSLAANGSPTDLGKFGIHTTRKRLIGVQREKKAAEQDFRAFEVLNLGRYERQAYLNVGGRLTDRQKAQALAQKEASSAN